MALHPPGGEDQSVEEKEVASGKLSEAPTGMTAAIEEADGEGEGEGDCEDVGAGRDWQQAGFASEQGASLTKLPPLVYTQFSLLFQLFGSPALQKALPWIERMYEDGAPDDHAQYEYDKSA